MYFLSQISIDKTNNPRYLENEVILCLREPFFTMKKTMAETFSLCLECALYVLAFCILVWDNIKILEIL